MRTEQIFFNNPHRQTRIGHGISLKKGVFCDVHLHPELEFLVVKSGLLECCADGNKWVAHAGEIIFINSNVAHTTETLSDETSYSFIQFRCPSEFSRELKYLSKFLNQPAITVYLFDKDDEDYEELKNYTDNMLSADDLKDIAHDYYITANMYMILALLYKKKLLLPEHETIDLVSISKILPVFDYVDKNYSVDFDLEQVANLVNLNKFYFCRLFKKATATTFTDYLNFVRVCKAEELIKKDMTISEAAYSAGFSSLSYFNRVFKKYKQYSPTIYKKISKRKEIIK